MPTIEEEIPRYLQNTEEVTQSEETIFSGKFPSWLKGNLFSSSPGIFDLDKGSVNNWFDGYAIISKFQIEGRNVTFTSKYVQSNAYKKALRAGKPVLPEFGTPPSTDSTKGVFAKLMPFGPYDCTDNTVGTIFKLGLNLYTAGDSCYFHEIDPETLDTLKTYHATKAYGMNSISSQPLEDSDGNVYLVGCAIQPTFRYSILKMSFENKNKKLEKRFEPICSFPSRWMFGACPCRNFGMTDNYIIMIEMPLVLNLMKLAATYIKGYCATDWLDWKPDDGVRFYIVDKTTGEVVKTEMYSLNPFITPMVVNAYENENTSEIILDVITMPNMDCNQATALSALRSTQTYGSRRGGNRTKDKRSLETGTLHRYIIPIIKDIKKLSEGECAIKAKSNLKNANCYSTASAIRRGERLIINPEILSEPGAGFDFGVINPNYRGRKYSFVYNTAGYISTSFSPYAYGIAKLNVYNKEVQMWHGKEGQVPSEPVFIPNPTSNSTNCTASSTSVDCDHHDHQEDDGILLTVVRMERSYEEDPFLLAVDAKTMKEIGRAYFKNPIAGWFHATFIKS